MRFIDWFAGIGGFRRGMELAGHECVGFCEFDKYAVMSYTAMHLCTQEQLDHLATLPLKERQKEILKEEYRNGEWYADDVRTVDARSIPDADCWCFGFPCQDISVAGKQLGFTGNRSSLFFRIMYMVGQLEEEKRPSYLFVENVKNLLSVNGGWDFARLLSELDKNGYDAEWQVLNSKYFGVPQNRERCFIIGHLRGRSAAEVFPVEGTNGANYVHGIGHRNGYRRNTQIFDPDGITEALDTGQGGGRGHHIIVVAHIRPDAHIHDSDRVISPEGIAQTLRERDYKEPIMTAIPVCDLETNKLFNQRGTVHDVNGISRTLFGGGSHDGNQPKVGIPITVKDGAEKGLYIQLSHGITIYAVWYPKKQCYIAIRKLTPKECFRLQGWMDNYFAKAQLVNSDSQLYKQAGNGVTVNVIEAIANKMRLEGNDGPDQQAIGN